VASIVRSGSIGRVVLAAKPPSHDGGHDGVSIVASIVRSGSIGRVVASIVRSGGIGRVVASIVRSGSIGRVVLAAKPPSHDGGHDIVPVNGKIRQHTTAHLRLAWRQRLPDYLRA